MEKAISKSRRTSGIRKADIAVIGIAGKFPGAANPEEFWKNLQAGKSSVKEVPSNRWDWKKYWGDPQTEKNKSNSKWGGFLDDVERFDPAFFGLSVKEVERMDPQQRIMLELTWSCFEDAGIPPSSVSGKKIGVFLGVFNFDYKELQERNDLLSIEAHHSTGTASAIIANRISYYFNFKGPSVPIDTACSSSLNAIHASIQSLHQGECMLAIAGGVNLLLTPTRHISFSKTGMLSPTGSCKTFDDGADGYVRGEGAGLLLLKPMAQAIADKDNIYGVIKGSAVNHGGKTYSLTYPNPDAQKEVIAKAQQVAGVTPESISYIEAHGTGTPKGDPIEFEGLTRAFKSLPAKGALKRKNYCGLGSVKTNVGHLEAAAGVAGVIKVLLSMKYKQLPGLQNFKKLNHRISLNGSPFYMVTGLRPWTPLKHKNKILPRRAGVSSFGFGGTNAHIVLEEPPFMAAANSGKQNVVPFYLICISAKTEDSLLQRMKDLADWLERPDASVQLPDVCKTLSLGREHFHQRAAIIATSIQDLRSKLTSLSNRCPVDGCFQREGIKKEKSNTLLVETGKLAVKILKGNKKISNDEYYQKLTVLAELYINGSETEWETPWFGKNGKRISLPSYPFARENYWIPEVNLNESEKPSIAKQYGLNPLLSQNTSNFQHQTFCTTITQNDFFIKDHIVKGAKVLPGVAYLEMARAAIAESTKGLVEPGVIHMKNIVWSQPVIVDERAVQINTSLNLEEDDIISFRIHNGTSGTEENGVVYSEGIAYTTSAVNEQNGLSIPELKETFNQKVLSADKCYVNLKALGFDYGPSHRALEAVYYGSHQLLAKLSLPLVLAGTINDFFLHPSLMDAALQAALLMNAHDINDNISPVTYLPFALDNMEIIAPCTQEMWAVITSDEDNLTDRKFPIKRLNIDLCNSDGKICVRMNGFSFKMLQSDTLQSVNEMRDDTENETLLLVPDWEEKAAKTNASFTYAQHFVFLCGITNTALENLQRQLPEIHFIVLQSSAENIAVRYQEHVKQLFEKIQMLLRNKQASKILIQVVVPAEGEFCLVSGLLGLLKTAHLENPNVCGQLIEISANTPLAEVLIENASLQTDRIRYIDGKRYVSAWKELSVRSDKHIAPWKENGVYLVTGGAGGLGFIFAKEIAEKAKNVSIILTGRSVEDESVLSRIKTLRALGAHVEYRRADVTDKTSLAKLIRNIQHDFNGLNGIIHSAGIIRDNFIIRKTTEEVMEVTSSKVLGVTYLDEVTRDIPLDFFVLFSSIVGALGNAGQADYAAANAYLDEYALYRNCLVDRNERHGYTLSVNWPLWRDGGMQMDNLVEKTMLEEMQMSVLKTDVGVGSLYRAMALRTSRILVAPGNLTMLKKKYLEPHEDVFDKTSFNEISDASSAPTAHLTAEEGISEKQVIDYFKGLLSTVIKRPVAKIDADAAMEDYGIDSIMVMQMTRQMESVFGTLPKTLFFEYQNIRELSHYFLENYLEQLRKVLVSEKAAGVHGGSPISQGYPSPVLSFEHNSNSASPAIPSGYNKALSAIKDSQPKSQADTAALNIAIIGVAGRYPQADNIHEFWLNLKNGKDCITEIPKERWDYRAYFDEDKEKEGKSYSKWGGFLRDVDKFDPLFFNISPLEAERMDPQERLFLQCVYETIEDAGYTRASLGKQKHFGLGNQVGVYVGVMYEEYQLFGVQQGMQGKPVALWGLPSSIANRVSYYCDFHGPSMAIDTMCSSSLTAIHLACESIARGKCEAAIAGGVNVSIHPNKYLFLSQGRFASSKGRCESFGVGGDGYVPGEGVGAVLLKPLANAIADGDNIYGIIKSTAVNHGGKTNGYTVPNPKAQASVIGSAFREAGIDPRRISYLEAHGTGTSLGDPIEILGLSKAFQEYTSDKKFCAIGSAKSNIGHCESAAGIAGVTKVLLQMKHKQIVPSLHAETLNANIDFGNSPFTVQQGLSEWNRPTKEKNGRNVEYPRYAGISSFGAGGANAHVVIEEYVPVNTQRALHTAKIDERKIPVIILLSAKDEDRLTVRVEQLLSTIRGNYNLWEASTDMLADVAYTLQLGREHMESRLALVVHSFEELAKKLSDFLADKKNSDTIYHGNQQLKTETGSIFGDEKIDVLVEAWIRDKAYGELLSFWVKGLKVDWSKLHSPSNTLRRVSLPTYPFRKDRYWVGEVPNAVDFKEGKTSAVLHPLLHANTSDFTGQRFSVNFTGDEFYLKDHIVNGEKILPASACLEMIREAVLRSSKSFKDMSQGIQLNAVTWVQPIVVRENPVVIHIELYLEDEQIYFLVYSDVADGTGEREVFCEGQASFIIPHEVQSPHENEILDIQKTPGYRIVSKTECYQAFERIGFTYGVMHQCLEQIYVGKEKLFAKILLPSATVETENSFVLHPGLMDAALQASLFWNVQGAESSLRMFLPVKMEEVHILKKIPSSAWVTISSAGSMPALSQNSDDRFLDVTVLNENGEICVFLKGVLLKAPTRSLTSGMLNESFEKYLLFSEWRRKDASQINPGTEYSKRLVVVCGLKNIHEASDIKLPDADIMVLTGGTPASFQENTLQLFEKIQSMLKPHEKGNILVQVLVSSKEEEKIYVAIAGLLRTAQKENPRFFGHVIILSEDESIPDVVKKIQANSFSPLDGEIRYKAGIREVLQWRIADHLAGGSAGRPWKDKGVYLITGGAGGLGFIFAKEIAAQANDVTLVLTGRSSLDDTKTSKLLELQKLGAKAVYQEVDVSDQKGVQLLIQSIRQEHGVVNGVIHSAGVTRDNYIVYKTADEWREVLAPKVSGVQFLDLATKDDSLDIFIFFSSITGAVGNAGQADYAVANAFMDAYAAYRNTLRLKGLRHGHTLSLNWPLWKDGGMQVDQEAEALLFDTMGIVPLKTESGLEALYEAIHSGRSQVMIAEGSYEKITERLVSQRNRIEKRPEIISPGKAADSQLMEEAVHYFKKLFSSIIKLPADKIKSVVSLEEYGIDSVMVMKMTSRLEKEFGILSKTLFFEYQNIEALARYFLDEHYGTFASILNIKDKNDTTQKAISPIAKNGPSQSITLASRRRTNLLAKPTPRNWPDGKDITSLDIAIVGVSGKYPGADNLVQFWDNLCKSKDCITEVPHSRWDHSLYFDADRNKSGKTYSKWGGFLNGVDEFDPLFFNISPLEAELLDPQERLFLQCAYETMEDAGYSREALALTNENGLSGNVGVYVGVMYEEYQLFGAQESTRGRNIALFGNPSSIANRVSYFYNFNGPSMAVDTMCSSSLTAIHLACQSIMNGDCKAAIAGGVNISIHPNKYLLLAQGKFISSKGRCESFGIGGDGYVPGEGVGAVFLKPLTQALADGDHVYGVIKGTSINHGGKTNGYTVPNPNAQAKVIGKAYERSGIDPRTISYLEAHGTGTSLGDPIEITGLKKAYREYTNDNNFCSIGSVKSNIGHCESAAGIAGLTKILLQMKYKKLVPSLHSSVLNPHIDFDNSPFVVQQQVADWERPVIARHGQTQEYPRRAGISSFGAGGANAHIVIEEYDENVPQSSMDKRIVEPVIIVLSGKNANRLQEVAERMLHGILRGKFEDRDLPGIAFTLQIGRDALESRLAIIVNSINELIEKLEAFVKGEGEEEGIFQGKVERDNGAIEAFDGDEELREAVEKWAARKKYSKLCGLWVKGLPIDWNILYKHLQDKSVLRRISLPTYPFARERYWLPSTEEPSVSDQQMLNTISSLQKTEEKIGTMLLQSVWKDDFVVSPVAATFEQHLIILAGEHHIFNNVFELEKRIKGAHVIKLEDNGNNIAELFQEYAIRVLHEIQNSLRQKPGGKILVQILVPEKNGVLSALDALLKTCRLENPRITNQLIEVAEKENFERIISILKENGDAGYCMHTRYKNSQRQISILREYSAVPTKRNLPWKEGGVYLITGGAGGIGLVLAGEILQRVDRATIILAGRSRLSPEREDQIKLIRTPRSNVIYKQADISRQESTVQLIRSIHQEFGKLNGIIHSAGVTRDKFLIHKTPADFKEVFASKVTGLVNLDEASKELTLDFFVLFSSIAGVLGNPGQTDYSTANAFMDRYAYYRNGLVAAGERKGHTISINWPLWKDGGMHVDKDVEKYLEEKTGILPMDSVSAIKTFYEVMSSSCGQLMPLYGDRSKISSYLLNKTFPGVTTDKQIPAEENSFHLKEKTLAQMKSLFGQAVKLSPERIDEKEGFQAYGLNSVMIVALNRKLESIFGELSKTLFYEYQNLAELTQYLIEDHQTSCIRWVAASESDTRLVSSENINQNEIVREFSSKPILSHQAVSVSPRSGVTTADPNVNEPIAIIGISGRYPMASSLREFWENIKTGRDCISEIPQERWRSDDFFHADKEKAIELGRSYSKWGGFIDDFADFDPLFFNISPREAVAMDPQERIFLQVCWQVFEDAGYTKEHLTKKFNGNVGVFAGVTKTGFELYSPELWRSGDEHRLRTSFSSVANRVSYHLNLRGPSMAIDTMCSASLTAIYEACENLQRGTCEMAIAGGVNLYLHPLNYIDLCSQSFLSGDGKCRSFGKDGNGFVPGEGVGAVLLKPLSRAIADGDNIHAIIKSASINHGGKTSGYTVPNPIAQAELIRIALDKAGVNARAVSYVEAHGTGTSLGDPIEIAGLSKAFREDTSDVQFCSIGSAKSNIGHLEAAAGIAGITKIVLQMKYGMLVPSLHASELNENINFGKSPFVVQQKLDVWNRPEVTKAGIKTIVPRIASISSFGAGGSNAHIILEEHMPATTAEEMDAPTVNNATALPALIVLSARDNKRLNDQAKQLLRFISDHEFSQTYNNLICTAYTLQIGREPMEERLAIKAYSVDELKQKLSAFVSGAENIGDLYYGRLGEKNAALDEERKTLGNALDIWIQGREFDNILQAWVKGHHIEWEKLCMSLNYPQQYLKRISLPVYPFAKFKYWLPVNTDGRNYNRVGQHVLATEDATDNREKTLPDVVVQDKQWLFTNEKWVSTPAGKNTDWTKRLGQFNEKRICIVYSEQSDLDGLAGLLQKLKEAAGLKNDLRLSTVQADDIDVQIVKEIRPEIVLVLGPRATKTVSVEPVEKDLSYVYNVSKCLMQVMWGDFIRLYYLFETNDINPRLDCEALSGFFRSAMKENDQHVWKSVRAHNIGSLNARHQVFLKEWLSDEWALPSGNAYSEILYHGEQRNVKALTETSLQPAALPSFRMNGTYLVAGGMGYIGGLLLQELAKKYNANLVIISKGHYDDARKQQCEELEQSGAKVFYHVGDITDMKAIQPIYDQVKRELGSIHGVINLARAHDSKSIITKSWESFYNVSLVKIQGTLNLDLLTRDEPLDVFMLFASIGAYGARGDSDYAYSVAFQNSFARYRNQLRKEGKRSGVSVSQCWGPWEEDKLFPESRMKMKSLGLDLIDMASAFPKIEATCSYEDSIIGLCAVLDKARAEEVLGVNTFQHAKTKQKATNRYESLVAQWEQDKVKAKGGYEGISIQEIQTAISVEEMKNLDAALVDRIYNLCIDNSASYPYNDKTSFRQKHGADSSYHPDSGPQKNLTDLKEMIRKCALEVLQLQDMDESKPFQHYGLDSIMAMRLSLSLGKALKIEIQPQWLIEFSTVAALADHLAAPSAVQPEEILPEADNTTYIHDDEDLARLVRDAVIRVLQIEDLNDEKPFQNYGLDSIMAMRLSTLLEKTLECEVKPNLLIEYPTVKSLSSYLYLENQKVII